MESQNINESAASTGWPSQSKIVATCIGGFLLLVVFWKKFGGSGKRYRLPPGPPGWPVLGHLPLIGRNPRHSLMKLSQKYGPLMSIRLGSKSAVVVSSPEMAKIFLRTQDHLFATRPPNLNGEVFMYNYSDIAFAPFSDKWRLSRRLVDSEIFSQKRLKHLKDFRDEEILAALERLLETCREGNLVDISSNVVQLSFDHICRICFNKRFFGRKIAVECEQRDLHSLMCEWTVIAGSFIVGDYIPFLRKLDLGGYEAALLRLRIALEKFLNPIIDEHRHKQEKEPIQDFLDVLLSLQREKAEDGFPDDQIKALLQDMLIGGTQTSSESIIWVLAESIRHPQVTRKIVDELDLVVGKDRLVEESDVVQLKYLKATVKESLRMYPPVPMSFPHQAMEDTRVAGYDIPKDTRVLVNLYGLGRDPSLWANPNTFDPERFIDNPVDVRGQHFELLPFGAGRRVCPGMDLGLRIIEMTVAQILHACILSLPPGVEVDVQEGPGITLPKAHPLHALVSPRLRPEVYSRYGMNFGSSAL